MIQKNVIQEIITYFARFVPKSSRKDLFKQTSGSRFAGYEELKAELSAIPEDKSFKELDSFIVSINNKIVSDRVKNSRNFLLFVEYGDINVSFQNGVTRNDVVLSISVGCELNESNNDMINEAMKMQRCLELMEYILKDMEDESKICNVVEFVTTPVKLIPLDPALFFGHGGWSASFTRKQIVV